MKSLLRKVNRICVILPPALFHCTSTELWKMKHVFKVLDFKSHLGREWVFLVIQIKKHSILTMTDMILEYLGSELLDSTQVTIEKSRDLSFSAVLKSKWDPMKAPMYRAVGSTNHCSVTSLVNSGGKEDKKEAEYSCTLCIMEWTHSRNATQQVPELECTSNAL